MLKFLTLLLALLAVLAHAQTTLIGTGGGGAPASNMDTPVMIVTGASGPSNSTTNYAGFTGSSWTSTESTNEYVFPINATVGKLTAQFNTTLTQGSWVLTFLDVTASTSFGGANSTITSVGPVQYFNDTIDTPLSVTAGDLVVMQAVPSGTPTNQTVSAPFSFVVKSTNGQSVLFAGGRASVNSAQEYEGFGGQPNWSTTEVNVSSIIPGPTLGSPAGQVTGFGVHLGANPAANTGYAMVIYKNGSPTTQGGGSACVTAAAGGVQATILAACTCVIRNGVQSPNNLAGGDAAVTYNAGDTISISQFPYGTPTSSVLNTTAAWTPTVLGQAIAASIATTLPSLSAARFGPMSGNFINASTEANAVNVAPEPITVKYLYSAIDTGSANLRTETLRNGSGNAGATPPTCGINTTTHTIGGVSIPSCTDVSNSYSIASVAAASQIDIQTAQPTANSVTAYYKTSVVVTAP